MVNRLLVVGRENIQDYKREIMKTLLMMKYNLCFNRVNMIMMNQKRKKRKLYICLDRIKYKVLTHSIGVVKELNQKYLMI